MTTFDYDTLTALAREGQAAQAARNKAGAAMSGALPDGYDPDDDLRKSIEFAYAAIRERVAAGGRGWRGFGPGDPRIPRPRGYGLRHGPLRSRAFRRCLPACARRHAHVAMEETQ
jgi:hypothetical protein